MEGNRVLPERIEQKPELSLNLFMFPFVGKMKVGDKGSLKVKGIIDREYKNDEDEIIKSVKITELKPQARRV